MIHIVYQQADVPALKKSFELDETPSGDVLEVQWRLAPIKYYVRQLNEELETVRPVKF